MDNVHAEQQRYAQAAFLHGNALQFFDFCHALDIEHATHLAFGYHGADVAALGLSGDDIVGRRKVQLAEFFLKGHFAHELVDEGVHFRIAARLLLAA